MTFKTIFIPIAHENRDEMKRNEFNDVKSATAVRIDRDRE